MSYMCVYLKIYTINIDKYKRTSFATGLRNGPNIIFVRR